jgi:hypothetical protein
LCRRAGSLTIFLPFENRKYRGTETAGRRAAFRMQTFWFGARAAPRCGFVVFQAQGLQMWMNYAFKEKKSEIQFPPYRLSARELPRGGGSAEGSFPQGNALFINFFGLLFPCGVPAL